MSSYLPTSAALTALTITLSSLLVVPLITYLFTSLRFSLSFRNFASPTSQSSQNVKPPKLPYAIPWLGNSLSFLNTSPHKFWKELFSWYPLSTGAVSILLGGNKTTMIFNTTSAQYIMRDRKMGRENFNEQVVMQGFGMSKIDCNKFYEYEKTTREDGSLPGHAESDRLNLEYLLKAERVNELTSEFVKIFKRDIANEFSAGPTSVNLYSWLRTLMFTASTTALMGSKILEVIPDLENYFFTYDQDMLSLFFGLPRWMIPDKYANRDASFDQMERWYQANEHDIGKDVPNPETIAWEPYYGSRVARARHLFYRRQGVSKRAIAALDFGMIFGISSNAIPATGWLLMYIIDSMRPENKVSGEPTLYDYILAEVEEAQNADGTLDIPLLINQPILLSTLHEVLRVYVDTLVSRQVPHDMHLPISSGVSTNGAPKDANHRTNTAAPRSIFLRAGELLMLPTWPSHNNPAAWSSPAYPHHPAADIFYPYRFLTASPTAKSGDKPVFTSSHTTGSFFPFGGGKTMCPGRTFAKQEIMAAVAMVLLTFEFSFEGYVDQKGRDTNKFPGLRDTLPGSAVCVAGGDMKISIRRRY